MSKDEQNLIAKAKKGNRKAFGELVELYMKPAYYGALTLVRNHEDALDLSQEAFLRAFRAIKSFRTGAKFYPWFHTILRNVCLTHLRKSGRRTDSVSMSDEQGDWEFPDEQPLVSEELEQRELEDRIWLALKSLKAMDREIILLKDFENMTYAEIAETLEIPIGTVMSRLYNARSRLREEMRPYLNSE